MFRDMDFKFALLIIYINFDICMQDVPLLARAGLAARMLSLHFFGGLNKNSA